MREQNISKKGSANKMPKMQWIYYVHKEGNVVAKVNSDAFDWRMDDIGFRRCSYAEYLQARKLIREREQEINIEGKVENEHG